MNFKIIVVNNVCYGENRELYRESIENVDFYDINFIKDME